MQTMRIQFRISSVRSILRPTSSTATAARKVPTPMA
jgi:hypothetical protein